MDPVNIVFPIADKQTNLSLWICGGELYTHCIFLSTIKELVRLPWISWIDLVYLKSIFWNFWSKNRDTGLVKKSFTYLCEWPVVFVYNLKSVEKRIYLVSLIDKEAFSSSTLPRPSEAQHQKRSLPFLYSMNRNPYTHIVIYWI